MSATSALLTDLLIAYIYCLQVFMSPKVILQTQCSWVNQVTSARFYKVYWLTRLAIYLQSDFHHTNIDFQELLLYDQLVFVLILTPLH